MTTKSGRVLLACDKFKGSLTASEVVEALVAGIRDARPDADVVAIPVGDGGDGTLEAALAAGFTRVPVTVAGPTGEPVDTAYALRDDEALIEMADACGLLRLPGGVRAPLTASSRGLGEAIAAAHDSGAQRLHVAVGGSASTDGGTGMLAALGVRFLDAAGADLPDGGGALVDLASVDLSGLDPRLADRQIVLATDVDNPLTGERGAAAVFGPQKGADAAQVARLDAGLGRLAGLVSDQNGRDDAARPGAGAAGGVGWAALAVLGATMRPGVEIVLGWSGFDALLVEASLVVTGEGSLDSQTLGGKTPAGVAKAAAARGVPVVAVCGRSLLDPDELAGTAIERVYALTELEPDPEACMRDAAPLLRRVAASVADDWLKEA